MLSIIKKTLFFYCDFFFTVIDKKKILILVKEHKVRYFHIPFYIDFLKEQKNKITFICSEQKKIKFIKFFSLFVESTKFKLKKKRLKLKGIGMKISFTKNSNFLRFKLGFSHDIFFRIPKNEIKISIKKDVLFLESVDKALVGNYAQGIKNLCLPDIYKGKGFLFSNEKILLKEIKKK